MTTLSKLITNLSEKAGVSKRPLRYFDVPKRGELTKSEIMYVKKRFKELVERERCVDADPNNPECYSKSQTDLKPRKKKRKSSYLKAYEAVYRPTKFTTDEFYKKNKGSIPRGSAPKGLKRISVETGIPLKYLKKVYDIGVGAYASSGSRTGMAAEQWGYGRVYAFIMVYFHNADGKYNTSRYFKNKTDFDVFENIVEEMM